MELEVGAGSKVGVGMVVVMQRSGLKVRRRARWDWAGISSRAGSGFGACERSQRAKPIYERFFFLSVKVWLRVPLAEWIHPAMAT